MKTKGPDRPNPFTVIDGGKLGKGELADGVPVSDEPARDGIAISAPVLIVNNVKAQISATSDVSETVVVEKVAEKMATERPDRRTASSRRPRVLSLGMSFKPIGDILAEMKAAKITYLGFESEEGIVTPRITDEELLQKIKQLTLGGEVTYENVVRIFLEWRTIKEIGVEVFQVRTIPLDKFQKLAMPFCCATARKSAGTSVRPMPSITAISSGTIAPPAAAKGAGSR